MRKNYRDYVYPLIVERDGEKCKACSSTENLVIDLIVSYLDDGKENLENLQFLCRHCWGKKQASRYAPSNYDPCADKDKKYRYVYLMKSENNKYKIGITNNLEERLRTIRKFVPYEVSVVHYFYTSFAYRVERSLHEKYASVRDVGEWFNLSDEHVKEICSMTGDSK